TNARFSSTVLSPSTAHHPRQLRLTTRGIREAGRLPTLGPTTPHTQPLPGITCARFSLLRFRSPLLTESRLFSLPTGTEMFHFPAFPPHALYIQAAVTLHHECWVSPFGHPRISARLAAPRGLSRPPTSFIGPWCQGIHHVLSTTSPQRCSHPLYNSQTPHPETTPTPRLMTQQTACKQTHTPNTQPVPHQPHRPAVLTTEHHACEPVTSRSTIPQAPPAAEHTPTQPGTLHQATTTVMTSGK